MSTGHIIVGILMFAAVTAVLYVWGLRKSMTQSQDLSRILLNRCGNRVVKYVRKHGTVTEKQIAAEISGMTAGEFWSRKRLKVQNPEKFAGEVAAFLKDQQYLEEIEHKTYRLKK